MKLLNKYLIITSIILHIVILIGIFFGVSHFDNVRESFKAGVDSYKYDNDALVKGVTEINRNGLKYKGYLVEMNGDDLYVPGNGNDDIVVGETVKIMTMVNSFNDVDTLTIVVLDK